MLADQIGSRDTAAIIDLEDRKTSRGAHRFSEPAEAGQMSVMRRTDSLPGASVVGNISCGRNRGSESIGRTPPDKFEFGVGGRPVFVGRVGGQRSNDKPVCDLSPTVESKRRPDNHRSNP